MLYQARTIHTIKHLQKKPIISSEQLKLRLYFPCLYSSYYFGINCNSHMSVGSRNVCQIVILSILENERKGQNLQLNLKNGGNLCQIAMSIGHIIILHCIVWYCNTSNLQTFRISYFQALRRVLRSGIPWNASKRIELG